MRGLILDAAEDEPEATALCSLLLDRKVRLLGYMVDWLNTVSQPYKYFAGDLIKAMLGETPGERREINLAIGQVLFDDIVTLPCPPDELRRNIDNLVDVYAAG